MLKRLTVLALLATAAAAHAAIPIRPQINITDYDIHTDLDPATGRMPRSPSRRSKPSTPSSSA